MFYAAHRLLILSLLLQVLLYIVIQQCAGSALHLLLVGVQHQMLGSRISILTWAFHPVSDHTAGGGLPLHL